MTRRDLVARIDDAILSARDAMVSERRRGITSAEGLEQAESAACSLRAALHAAEALSAWYQTRAKALTDRVAIGSFRSFCFGVKP